MVKNLTMVVYKPDTQSTDELFVYVDAVEYRKWKAGDTSIPLVDIVDSFDVFHTGQGAQGLQKRPSNQQLETIFGTHKDIDVVEQILKQGKEQNGELQSGGYVQANKAGTRNLNQARGSAVIDTRGAGLTGIGR